MGSSLLASIINLYITPPGRRVYALRRVRERAERRGLTVLVKRIDRALAHEKHVSELEGRWGSLRSQVQVKPSDIDPQIDRTLRVIDEMLADCAADSDAEVARYAADLRGTLYPQSVADHTQLPYIEQLLANERVLDVLESKERKAWVDRLGLRMYAGRLRRLNEAFHGALLNRDDEEPMTYAEVREARDRGQRHYAQIAAIITGQFCEDEDEEVLLDLMEPIQEQNEALRAYRVRRRRASDVDADTGEPLDDSDAPADDAPASSGDE